MEIDYDKGVRKRTYRLLQKGFNKGQEHLKTLDEKTQKYIGRVASFVVRVSFAELVSAIYREYPEMKVNSVFRS